MLGCHRIFVFGACAYFLVTADATAAPFRHNKTIKQCSEELAAGRAALTAAGESPAKFIHDCWWQTNAGEPTPIAGTPSSQTTETTKRKAADETKARTGASDGRRAIEPARSSAPREMQASRKSQPHPAPTLPQADRPHSSAPAETARRSSARRLARRPDYVPVGTIERVSHDASRHRMSMLPDAARVRPEPANQQAQGEMFAGMAWVPVHIATMPQPIRWPVLPEFVPSFRYAVNHPIVPGLTWTP